MAKRTIIEVSRGLMSQPRIREIVVDELSQQPTVVAAAEDAAAAAIDAEPRIAVLMADSVYLADYVSSANTAAQNRAGYVNAIAAAAAGSKHLCYDGAYFTFEGAAVTDTTADMVHWATDWDTHKVTNVTRPEGVLRIEGANSRVSGLNIDGANPGLLGLNGYTSNQRRFSNAVLVTEEAHGTQVQHVRAAGFFCAVQVAAIPPEDVDQPGFDPLTHPALNDVVVDDIYSDGCWAALQFGCVDNIKVRRLVGWWDVEAIGSAGHLLYGGAFGINHGVMVDDCFAISGNGLWGPGPAYKFRDCEDLHISNLRANNCPGLLDMEKCHNFTVGTGVAGWNLTSDDTNFGVRILNCTRGSVAPVQVRLGDHDLSSTASLFQVNGCEDVQIDRPLIRVAPSVHVGGSSAMVVTHTEDPGVVIHKPLVINEGTAPLDRAYVTANSTTPSQLRLEHPKLVGDVYIGVLWAEPAGGTLLYDPADLPALTTPTRINSAGAADVRLIPRAMPDSPDVDGTLVAWHTGSKVAGSAVNTAWPTGQLATVVANPITGDDNGMLTAPGGMVYYFTGDFGAADIDARSGITLGTGLRAGFALRAVDGSNMLFVTRGTGKVEIGRRLAGVTTILAQNTVSHPDTIRAELRAIIVGDNILAFLDGQLIVSHTLTGGDEVTFASAQNHGIYQHGGGASTFLWPRFRTVT